MNKKSPAIQLLGLRDDKSWYHPDSAGGFSASQHSCITARGKEHAISDAVTGVPVVDLLTLAGYLREDHFHLR